MPTARRTKDEREDDGFVEPGPRIAEEVARAKGVDILDLDPLFETIDTDALATLLENPNQGVAITFEYEGYTVNLRSDGRLTLDE